MGKIKIYIEGGGNRILNSQLREAFMSLMKQCGIELNLFHIVAGGSRARIYNDFSKIFQDSSVVLIDSEKEIPCDETINKWDFLCKNETWDKPKNATEENLFFMAACMESWIVADENALRDFYGDGFKAKLPQTKDLSVITKDDIMSALEKSTKECGKKYDKKDSFKILEKVKVSKIVEKNYYAKEFFDFLKQQQENNT